VSWDIIANKPGECDVDEKIGQEILSFAAVGLAGFAPARALPISVINSLSV
jgi:hypothetical protein